MNEVPDETEVDESSHDNDAPESTEAVDKAFEEIEAGAEASQPEAQHDGSENNTIPMDDLESLKTSLAEKEDQLLRAAAELENVRKRGRREAEDARKFASTNLLTDLLTIVDDLNRAVEAAETNEENSGLLSGVKMVSSQLNEVLNKHHCKKIEALGQPFDPNLHEAIQMQPSADYDANTVSLEARTGYQYHDRVLRTSQVFVSTGKPQPPSPESSDKE